MANGTTTCSVSPVAQGVVRVRTASPWRGRLGAFPLLSFGILAFVALLVASPAATAARKSRRSMEGADSETARIEYKINDMLSRGQELIRSKQEERGIKLIRSIPENYPSAELRFKAYLVLGDYYKNKRDFDLALKHYEQGTDAEGDDVRSEAVYNLGICNFRLNRYDKAFVMLRKVIDEFPWSVYANQAYYYIGMCHYKLGRWARAVEALKLVGTSVQPNTEKKTLAEAGQRLFINIADEDLIVTTEENATLVVTAQTASGDKEQVTMSEFAKSGIRYQGSIQTELGSATPNDGTLQCIGGDVVEVVYSDLNTLQGKRNKKRIAEVQMVSTASAGFTDGAYREYTKGVFVDQQCFVRVKDLDGDTGPKPDRISVTVRTQYEEEKEVDYDKRGVQLDDEEAEIKQRSEAVLTLIETAPHSGIFTGAIELRSASRNMEQQVDEGTLYAKRDDQIVLEYQDERHLNGDEPRQVTYTANVLSGAIQDVKVEHRLVESLGLKARKNLIEAKMYRKLGQIFKEVGLKKQAYEKADYGLKRAETVISAGIKAGLERGIIEEAFNVKWDLLMVKDQLREAIRVCNTLIRMFPDSTLVDQALMKLAKAKMEQGQKEEATGILHGILRLKNSDLKAEAQFMIAKATEEKAVARAQERSAKPDLSRAMMEYKKCANEYPDSSFAGEALGKIANYYIQNKDYQRAIELMEQVFQDYPDASFLDQMLLKWAISAYRIGELEVARDKVARILSEYPGSDVAGKAKKILQILDRKLGG